MKKTKLLAVTAILLLTSCSPKVVTHIVRTYPNPVPADSVYVIEPGDTVPNTAETLGSVSVVDRGTSRNCRYDQVLRLAQEATGKNGGNGLAITEHVKPSFWGSSCHQINALMLHLTDTKVNATEGNPVQDMIDLGRVAVREEKEKRRAPANTFEASFGYGWVTSKMYDINGATLDSKGGIDWKLAYEYTWSNGMGIGLQYSGFRKSFSDGGDMTFSYIAPEWVGRSKFDRWILKSGLGMGVFLYHDPLYSATGFGFHATVGVEYMLSANWGLGLTLNGISGSLPKQDWMLLKEDERCGITRFNLLGGLRYYF